MKTIAIGDIHGRSVWKLITNIEKPDRVIFVGDYFDSFDIKGADQLSNFLDILTYKESEQCEVILLIGNHDHHYFPEIGDTGTSGYQHLFAPSIQYVIGENKHHLQMAYQMDNLLFTHAGVSTVFMDAVFGKSGWNVDNVAEELNELFKYKPHAFTFSGWDPYGNDEQQTPIWIRPTALMRSNKKTELKEKYIQVYGHTETPEISLNYIKKAAGGKYYDIDCLGTSGEYMIIEDGEISFNSWR
jgi:hypothetical protein